MLLSALVFCLATSFFALCADENADAHTGRQMAAGPGAAGDQCKPAEARSCVCGYGSMLRCH
jgi:hypothetical protein